MKRLFRLYKKAFLVFLAAGIIFTFGTAFYFTYLKTPAFYWKLEKDITSNTAFLNKIGGYKEVYFKYSDSLRANNRFKITVVGECDSTSIIIRGIYTDDKYAITDTTIRGCK